MGVLGASFKVHAVVGSCSSRLKSRNDTSRGATSVVRSLDISRFNRKTVIFQVAIIVVHNVLRCYL